MTWIGLRRPPCVDLQVCLDSHRLYAMHDGTFQTMQQTAQRNLVQQIDLETQQTIMAAHEFSEHFELVCLAPGQGVATGATSFMRVQCTEVICVWEGLH